MIPKRRPSADVEAATERLTEEAQARLIRVREDSDKRLDVANSAVRAAQAQLDDARRERISAHVAELRTTASDLRTTAAETDPAQVEAMPVVVQPLGQHACFAGPYVEVEHQWTVDILLRRAHAAEAEADRLDRYATDARTSPDDLAREVAPLQSVE